MPTWLRKYTFKQIQDFLEKKNTLYPSTPNSNKKVWDPSKLLGKSNYK